MAEADLDAALGAARLGDEVAVAVVFRSLQPLLLRYLARQAPGEAEDLAGEVWHAAARILPGFAGSAADFRAVLFTIARRRVADHYRARTRRPAPGPELAEHDGSPGVSNDPAELVVERLSAEEAIEVLVGGLPADQAEVVLLRVVAGLSVAEVAEATGRRPGAVRVLQHRALRRLAGKLERRGVTR